MAKIKLTEEQLKSIVTESVKRVLKENNNIAYGSVTPSMTGPSATGRETWRGVPGTRFIWHGEWADPEIEYKGHTINANEVEDFFYTTYKEEMEEYGYDMSFDDWMTKQGQITLRLALDDMIGNN